MLKHTQNSYPSEGEKLVDDLLESQGITRRAFLKLASEERRRVVGEIRRQIVPSLREVRPAGRPFDAHIAANVREQLGLEKWTELAHIVSYVRTQLATSTEEHPASNYDAHVAFGVDLNELQRTLSRVYDVTPARIDTDIRHQTNSFYRAVVELVSNAADASQKTRSPIGRFGVGFYQILNHLRTPEDRLVITTKTVAAQRASRIEFRLKDGTVHVKIQECDAPFDHGTHMELRARGFEEEPATSILTRCFEHNQDVVLLVNGVPIERWQPDGAIADDTERPVVDIALASGCFSVLDRGTGMSPQTVFEKLLVPKLSSKPSVHELEQSCEPRASLRFALGGADTRTAEAILQVGGIRVESESAVGVNLAETVVIDLPPSTVLGEQRDRVDVDETTIAAMKQVISDATHLPPPECFAVLNTLASACRRLQARSRVSNQGGDLLAVMRSAIRTSFPDRQFLPNTVDFLALRLPLSVALLDPDLVRSPLAAIPGFVANERIDPGCSLRVFRAPFADGSTAGFILDGDALIIDERVKVDTYPSIFLAATRLATDRYITLRPSVVERASETLDAIRSLEEFAGSTWRDLGFPDAREARRAAADMVRTRPTIVRTFTEHVLRHLPTGARASCWELLGWYVYADARPKRESMAEIIELGANLTALQNDAIVQSALSEYAPALVSLMERTELRLPQDVEDADSIVGRLELDGVEYLVEPSDSSDEWKLYDTEGRGHAYSKIGLEMTPLFDPSRVVQRPAKRGTEPVVWMQLEGRTFELEGGKLKIDGKRQRLWSTPGQYVELFGTTEGGVRIASADIPPDAHIYAISDVDRGLLGMLSLRQTRVRYGARRREHEHVRVDGLKLVRTLHAGDKTTLPPGSHVARAVRDLVWIGGKMNEHVCALSTEGEVVDLMTAVDAPTLALRYDALPSCTCCGAPGFREKDHAYLERYLRLATPLRAASDSASPTHYVPFGQFYYDLRRKQWFCAARAEVLGAMISHVLLIFDERGMPVATAPIGRVVPRAPRLAPDMPICEVRDVNLRLAQRLPGRLQGLGKHDEAMERVERMLFETHGWSAEAQHARVLRSRVTSGPTAAYYDDGGSVPSFLERDARSDGIFEARGEVLTTDHVQALGDFLALRGVHEREDVERLLYRSLQFRDLHVRDFRALLPAFYERKTIDARLVRHPLLPLLRALFDLEPQRFCLVLGMIERILPDELSKAERMLARFLKFFAERLQGEPEEVWETIDEELCDVKAYGEDCDCSAATLIRTGQRVEAQRIPRAIRPLYTFLLRDDHELARARETQDRPTGPSHELRLSELIQWKRLHEGEAAAFTGGPADLAGLVHRERASVRPEHVQREITHAIHFQSLDSTHHFIRELVQNGVDAIRQSAEHVPPILHASTVLQGERGVTFTFEDPVGMETSTLLNYFLVPGESTKRDGQSLGFFGQGVFSLFARAERVTVETSPGGGVWWELELTPIVEHDLIRDVQLTLRSRSGDGRGTKICVTERTDHPLVAAAYLHDAIITMVSALDTSYATVEYQGEVINATYPELAHETAGQFGDVRILRNPNNVLCHRGLYVRDIEEDDLDDLPGVVWEVLRDSGGIAIELPPGIELTRSRDRVANEEVVAEALHPALMRALSRAFLAEAPSYFHDHPTAFPYANLPYDYFRDRRYVPDLVDRDTVRLLITGGEITDTKRYHDAASLAKLLSLLPCFTISERRLSLEDLRVAYASHRAPFDSARWRQQLPEQIVEMIERDEERSALSVQFAGEQASEDVSLDRAVEIVPPSLKESFTEHSGALRDLQILSRRFFDVVAPAFGEDPESIGLTFYFHRSSSLAHANMDAASIGWNLYRLLTGQATLHNIERFRETGKPEHIESVLRILSHEFAHLLEGMEKWSHNKEHDAEQARILLQALVDDRIEALRDMTWDERPGPRPRAPSLLGFIRDSLAPRRVA